MSKILCIIDGMTDSYFDVADYPNLSSMHLLRYIDTTQGQEAESLGCILRLLGVKSVPPYLRGYAEALGNGILVNKNDLILRGSWFALDVQGCCSVPISAPKEVSKMERCYYYHLEQYKSLLVFPNMAKFVSDMITYPPYMCAGQSAWNLCPKGCGLVRDVFQSQLTKEHCLIPWGQSVYSNIEPFPCKAAVISGTSVVKGIAKLLSMHLILVPGATGDIDTDLLLKTKTTLDVAQTNPFVLLHINGADEAGHRKNFEEKQAFLHKVDSIVLKLLLDSNHSIYVVSDHGTDPITGQHIGNKQPLFVNDSAKVIF